MAISHKTRKVLWARSGSRCALCRENLIVSRTASGATIVGDECHIRSGVPGGPRFEPSYPPEAIDTIDNLLLLCRVHHKQVDDEVLDFSAARLASLKAQHEAWVESHLAHSGGPNRIRWNPSHIGERLLLLDTGGKALAIVGAANMQQFRRPEPLSYGDAGLIGDFIQHCRDLMDICDEMDAREEIMMTLQMTSRIEELRCAGYLLFGAIERHDIVGGTAAPFAVDVAIMAIHRVQDPRIVVENGAASCVPRVLKAPLPSC